MELFLNVSHSQIAALRAAWLTRRTAEGVRPARLSLDNQLFE
jgi:hypothetical protein